MIHLLLFKEGGGENDALAPLLDTGAKKKRAQVLLYSARTDVKFCGNIFIAATLHQKIEDLPVAACDFDLIEIKHDFPFAAVRIGCGRLKGKARLSPYFRPQARKANYQRNQHLPRPATA
jgi:hypothetical protein